MRIAIAADAGSVSHFGHCSEFLLVDLSEGKITGQSSIKNPGHKPGFLPQYLKEQGVDLILSGGMGASAAQLFRDLGISIVTGAEGNIQRLIEQYIRGEITPSESVCTEHHHRDECHK